MFGAADPEGDADTYEQDLAEFVGEGVTEEQLEDLRQRMDAQLEIEQDEQPEDFTVWPANAEAIAVFQRCGWDRVLAGDRLLYTGIAAGEIRNVMDLIDVPPERRAEVFDQVRYAAEVVIPRLNGE